MLIINDVINIIIAIIILKNVNVIDREVNYEEMEKFFNNSRAIILPYESATQSGVIVDSYKYSKPVIAYNVGAIIEQVEDGVSGFLVQSGNIEEFCEKLKLINDMTMSDLNKLQKNAYEFGYEKYSSKKRSKDFIKIAFIKYIILFSFGSLAA